MQRYSISQLPVVRDGELDSLADVIGSLQDRDLLDRVFKNPDALHEDVAAAMQPPLAAIDADEKLDEVFSTLSGGRAERGRRRRGRQADRRPHPHRPARVPGPQTVTEVSPAEARRIAVRAQLLDGSAKDVLSTVRRLGRLQIDPISTVAPPQYLVLWSRLGPYDRAELDRLLWEKKKLFEWNAFIYPVEDLPLIRALMREPWGQLKWQRWAKEFMKEQAGLRRYILRELERDGPLPSRELEHHAARADERTVWWGTRAQMTWMLELLHRRGKIAVAGRQTGQRLWDLAERVWPETETVPLAEARRVLDDMRFRAQGVRLDRERFVAHPDADGRARAPAGDVPLPLRRPRQEPRPRRGALGLLLPARDVRPEGEARVRVLRPPDPARRPRHRPHRAGVRPQDEGRCGSRASSPSRVRRRAPAPSIAQATRRLGKWLGAEQIAYSRRVPAIWRDALRN